MFFCHTFIRVLLPLGWCNCWKVTHPEAYTVNESKCVYLGIQVWICMVGRFLTGLMSWSYSDMWLHFMLQEICSLCFRCIRKSNTSFRRAMWWIYIQLHRAKVSLYLYYYAWVWHKYSKLCEQYSVTINWMIFRPVNLI